MKLKFCRDCKHCFTGLERYDIKVQFQEKRPTILPPKLMDVFEEAQCLAAQHRRHVASGRFPYCLVMRDDEEACGNEAQWWKAKEAPHD